MRCFRPSFSTGHVHPCRYERTDVAQLDLADLTAVAERTMTNDLEYLIEKAVDPRKHADYAVVTGVQVRHALTTPQT